MRSSYDKAALYEYMDEMGGIGKTMQRAKGECSTAYNSCKQQYTKLHTELEQLTRKAYNKIEAAESMQRAADAEFNLAIRLIENANDESSQEIAQKQLHHAQVQRIEAANEMEVASAEYSKAQANMKSLIDVWEKYRPQMELAAHKIEDGFSSYTTMVENSNRELGEYMSIMDKARSVLFEENAVGQSFGTSANHTSYQPSKTDANIRSSVLNTRPGNAIGLATVAGATSIVMSLGGKEHSFPNTKSGAAKAYRTAKKSGDSELVSKAERLFASGRVSREIGNGAFEGNRSEETFNNKATGNINTSGVDNFITEDSIGLSETEKTVANTMKDFVDQNVTQARLPKNGMWSEPSEIGNSAFIISDDATIVWQKKGKHSCTGAELKRWMDENYGTHSVYYDHKEPDFFPFIDKRIGLIHLEKMSTDRSGETGSFSQAENEAIIRLGLKSRSEIKRYMESNELTWHECADGHTVIAIPTRINSAFKHSGGISLERSTESVREVLSSQTEGMRLNLQRDSPNGTVEGLRQAIDEQHKNFRNKKSELYGK